MATLIFRVLLLLFIFSDPVLSIKNFGMGINYGQNATSLPSPSRVVSILQSFNATRVRLYNADPTVLLAFADTRIEITIELGNEHLQRMTEPNEAQTWIQQHVQPYISRTKIKYIIVGNQVSADQDKLNTSYILPAMKTITGALTNLGLNKQIFVTTIHSFGIIESNMQPPTTATFAPSLVRYIRDILDFLNRTQSPFLIHINVYEMYTPFKGDLSLEYALFQPNSGYFDPLSNLFYDNYLYELIDWVYLAMEALGHTDIQVIVSDAGWPSKGNLTEVQATPENAGIYVGNLLNRIQQNQGTPARPNRPVQVFGFKLFNEGLMPGPTTERNYGLYNADGTPAYRLGLQGYLPRMDYSASQKNVRFFFNFIAPLVMLLCCL